MKMNHPFAIQIVTLISAVVLGLFCFAGLRPRVAKADDFQQNPAAGPAGSVIVQDRFGGQILGFDIDQASDEGVLSEYRDLNNGTVLAAVETFSQTTGQIIRVVAKTRRQDGVEVAQDVEVNFQRVAGVHVLVIAALPAKRFAGLRD